MNDDSLIPTSNPLVDPSSDAGADVETVLAFERKEGELASETHKLDVVPVAFCTTRKKSAEPEGLQTLKIYSFDDLKGKDVKMLVAGFWARGKLVGVDDENVYLRGLHRWWVYPLECVSQLMPVGAERSFAAARYPWEE
ncbi:MAG: hypothetical protein GY822_02720 [Deltaproteobacteria bacterium]|nr:hypothetical protein [Deltaproteobacteria bacterium]